MDFSPTSSITVGGLHYSANSYIHLFQKFDSKKNKQHKNVCIQMNISVEGF